MFRTFVRHGKDDLQWVAATGRCGGGRSGWPYAASRHAATGAAETTAWPGSAVFAGGGRTLAGAQ